jgi:hypothetical protein
MQPVITEEGPSITEEAPQSPNTCTIPTIPLSRWPPRTRRPTPELFIENHEAGKFKELLKFKELFIGFRKTGKFKELLKFKELIIGERGARFARIRVT